MGEGAVIRDLTVVYELPAGTTLIVTNFGGIAAQAEGAQFINVLVKGAVAVSNTNTIDFAKIGGIVGQMTGGSTITNAYSGIVLTIGGTGARRVGGFVGDNENSGFDGVTFEGSLRSSGTIGGHTYLGGIIGYNEVNDDGSLTINDCIVRGNIDYSGNATKTVGGIIGYSWRNIGSITISNAFFEAGDIIVKGSGSTMVGGFSSDLIYMHTINNCGSLGGTITVDTTSGDITVGGFISDFTGDIGNCFSRINIIVNGAGNIFAGGFLGAIQSNSTINGCYASGSVRVIHNGSAFIGVYAGGLAGYSGGTINNSYALGNVLTDKQSETGRVYAGGLVGFKSGSISNCFSAGQVTAQSAESEVYAGGIVGYRDSGTVSNTAALGGKVTAAGGSTTGAGRIAGNSPNGSNNYAINSMLVGTGAYNAYIPGEPPETNIGGSDINGASIGISETLSTIFWGTNLGFSSQTAPNPSGGTYSPWDLSAGTIIGRGHPLLLNPPVNGRQTLMAGQ